MLNKELLMMGSAKVLVNVTIQYRASKVFPVLQVKNADTSEIYFVDETVDAFNRTANLSVPAGTSLLVTASGIPINVLQLSPPWTNTVQPQRHQLIIDIADQEVFIEIEIAL